jgi:hypothetical protein
VFIIIDNVFREFSSVGSILHYIYRDRNLFELRSSHLSILKMKFLVSRVLNQKNNINIKNVMTDIMTAEFKPPLFPLHVRVYNNFKLITSSI